MSNQKFIRCVDDFLESVEFTGIKIENFSYRGQVNENWEISSTVMRDINGQMLDYEKSRKIELASLKTLITGTKSNFCRTYHPIEHLMHLQHQSIPTRLIDWTRDALVALFFSCFDKKHLNSQFHGKLFLFLIYKEEFEHYDLFQNKENELHKNFNLNLIQDSIKELLKLDEIKILEPLIKTPRMRAQNGIFTLIPLWKSEINQGTCKTLEELLKEMSRPLVYFLVHKDYKSEILIELKENYGISEETLFINTKNIIEEEIKSLNTHNDNIRYIKGLFDSDI